MPDSPTTTVPDDGTPAPDRPARGDRENCPDKEGTEGSGTGTGTGTGTNLNLRTARGGGRL